MTSSLSLRLQFRVILWFSARLLPLRVRHHPLGKVLRLAEPVDRGRFTGLSPSYISKRIQRTTHRPWLMRDRPCLRSGLLGYRFLSEAGYRPALYFGLVDPPLTAPVLVAHCWVCLDGMPVVSDRLKGMTTILIHPPQAVLEEAE